MVTERGSGRSFAAAYETTNILAATTRARIETEPPIFEGLTTGHLFRVCFPMEPGVVRVADQSNRFLVDGLTDPRVGQRSHFGFPFIQVDCCVVRRAITGVARKLGEARP